MKWFGRSESKAPCVEAAEVDIDLHEIAEENRLRKENALRQQGRMRVLTSSLATIREENHFTRRIYGSEPA